MALKELSIRHFAIIKNLEIEIDNGLTIITGETGAGKSIVLDALELILGARADVSMVRHGEQQCEISALFDLKNQTEAGNWLAQHDFEHDGYCLIRRVIHKEKPTKCYINDQSTTLNSLKQLGLLLVDLHGQHEHQSLLRKTEQRSIIDDFAKNKEKLIALKSLSKEINKLDTLIKQQQENQQNQDERLALLSFQLNELDEVNIQPDEFELLEKEQTLLSNAQSIIETTQSSLDALYFSEAGNGTTDSISSQLGSVILNLEQMSQVDSGLQTSCQLLNSALAQIDEAKSELQSSLARIDQDPERLNEVNARIDQIIHLSRKHRCQESELVSKHQQIAQEYKRLEQQQQQPEQQLSQLKKLQQRYLTLAQDISKNRQQAASLLSKAISEQMQELGMQGGQLLISVSSQNIDSHWHYPEHGIDVIEFLVCTNQGMPLQALHKTASGGELSRISLAIQVITSTRSSTPTLVFDEVDVGIGGRVAQVVGQRLKALGAQTQVLCITHLPQVAAQGEQHLYVDKAVENQQTYSFIRKLNKVERTEEVARMLGGSDITDRTLAHAEEMINQA